ncbi:YbaB/EbfC family nucleoid-associated protein [Mycobacterium sp. NPDC003449]
MTEVLALVSEQMADIAAMQQEQAQLTATGEAADGLVVVTVNAQGHVIGTAIDESYLDEFEFEELGEHLTAAAQSAAQAAADEVAAMMVPLGERRRMMPALSEIVDGAPDLRDLTDSVLGHDGPIGPPRGRDDDGLDESAFPTVRS